MHNIHGLLQTGHLFGYCTNNQKFGGTEATLGTNLKIITTRNSLILTIFLQITIGLGLSSALAASPKVQEGVFIYDNDGTHFRNLKANKELVIDHRTPKGYELYGPKGIRKYLKMMDIPFFELLENDTDKAIFDKYPTPEEIEKVLKQFAAKYPKIMKLFSIGKSVDNRELWMVKLSDNVQKDEVEPEVKYIANMHGNEIVGRELMVLLIKDLLEAYQAGDHRVRELLNNNEVFIMPTMNPDGSSSKRRGNAKWTDLNRDFPDFTTQDNQNSPNGRDPETNAVMKLQAERHFSLSANFHGGTKVVNYPWDTSNDEFPMDDLIKELSLEYAKENQDMRRSRRFKNGIVNGYKWYEVDGGMQDWSYHWHGDLQVTIELSDTKWPSYDTMDDYYKENRESLVRYLERVSQGAGFKTSDRSLKGMVEITKIGGDNPGLIGTFPFGNGEYYKILLNGKYQFKVTGNGKTWKFQTEVDFKNISTVGNYTSLDQL